MNVIGRIFLNSRKDGDVEELTFLITFLKNANKILP